MKYSNGGWLIKEGYEVSYAAHCYEYSILKDRLILYAPFNYTDHKGQTLDGGMMTIELSSPAKDIVGIKMYHHKGQKKHPPKFELNMDSVKIEVLETDENLIFKTGNTEVKISLDEQLQIDFYYCGKLITQSFPRSKAWVKDDNNVYYISEQLSLSVDEKIYGLGERFTPFVKNGQTIDIWNEDGGTGTEQSYKNIPFYVSNKNYGVFVNSPDKVSYEIGSEKVSRVQFSVPGEVMEYFVLPGETLKEVLSKYTDLTGKATMPPAWSFGLWLSTSFLTDYDETTVTEFVDGMIERDIPLDVFHFDCLWMREYEWCNFTWDERMFPDPEAMLRRLKEKGLKICVWINPYIAQKSPLFDEGYENGYLLLRENGDVWQWDKWQAGLAVVDFTNPKAVDWYCSKLKVLLDMGVDSFKTDFGERIPTDVVYFNGADPNKMHNYYAYLYNEVVFDLLEKERGTDEAVVFARSASVGSQKFPVHWGGDCTSDYPSMAESLRAGLSFGLSGFAFWSHDIGGFEAGCSPDLYKRWTQFGLLSSHSRYHGSWEYKVPWLYGDEAVEVTRFFTKLKLRLMPYLIRQSKIAVESGTPVMRAMVIDFSEDLTTHTLDQQYMLGENLLVAPIFNDQGTCTFYVPNGGKWTHYLTNKIYEGGKWYQEKYDYFDLPLLARPNSLIVEGLHDQHAEYDYTKNIVIHAFEITQDVQVELPDLKGNTVAAIKIECQDNNFRIYGEGIDRFKIIFHNRNFKHANATQTDMGTELFVDSVAMFECDV